MFSLSEGHLVDIQRTLENEHYSRQEAAHLAQCAFPFLNRDN